MEKGQDETAAGIAAAEDNRLQRRGRLPRPMRFTLYGLSFVAACFLAGFAVFSNHVANLGPPRADRTADGIIVLTGGHQRISTAIALLKTGHGARLLISGVNPIASRDELRAISGADRALFSCCVDIDIAALDTIGNAEESAKWLRRNAYNSVIMVTSNYHIPRSMLELRRTAGAVEIIPWPVVNTPLEGSGWLSRPRVMRVFFTEYTKYVAALVRAAAPRVKGTGESESMRAALGNPS